MHCLLPSIFFERCVAQRVFDRALGDAQSLCRFHALERAFMAGNRSMI
jgi:hypothetical protein